MTRKKQVRTWEWQDWPEQTLEHYKSLFSLQERLRAHLKVSQELARKNRLSAYRKDQWPDIKEYLSGMQKEIRKIKAVYKGGRPPKWFEQITEIETLAEEILDKMESIQTHIILTLKQDNIPIEESRDIVVEETADVLGKALEIREALTLLRPDQSFIGLDEYGLEAIILPTKQKYYLDYTELELWQKSQHKSKQG